MKKKILSMYLVIALLLNITMPAILAVATQNDLDELEEQLSEAEEQQEEVAEEKEDTLDEIEELTEQIEEYEEEIEELETQIASLEKSISAKETEIKKLEKEYEEKEEAFIQRLVAMYEAGTTTYLDVLLSSDSIVNFISNYYMVSELADADNAMMESILEQQTKIEEAKEELEEQKEELSTSKTSLESKKSSLTSAKSSKEAKVESLTEEEKELQEAIDEFNDAIKEAQKEIAAAIAAAEKKTAASGTYTGSFSGTLSWPVSTSSSNWNVITSGYGTRTQPTAGASTNHKAVDIGISYQPVYAAADGYVVTATTVSGYGKFIMIKHSDDLYTCYGHLSSFNVSTGDTVSRGQQIAVSGNTGI